MNSINIKSHALTFQSVSFETFVKYSKIECGDITKITKKSEEEDLACLIEKIEEFSNDYDIFRNFYFNYKIAQISKEFDLLRLGINFSINIELKRNCKEEKVKSQLIQNRYYLKHISKIVYSFSYIIGSNTLYQLIGEKLETVNFEHLTQLLVSQEVSANKNIDDIFKPSEFLISPFNTPEQFVNNEYFLTDHQKIIKDKIIHDIGAGQSTSYHSISGNPGTGKTLLTYDIVKELKNDYRICIIHCGFLNDGHSYLSNHGFKIYPAKHTNNIRFENFDLVVLDECQRIYENQLELILKKASELNLGCIFSFDPRQTLSDYEASRDVPGKILSLGGIKKYKLTNKIRTNQELSSFITNLFNLNKYNANISYNNISVVHFDNDDQAKTYISYISNNDWSFINYTYSMYHFNEHATLNMFAVGNAHQVVGQEFDNVAILLDSTFGYNSRKELASTGWSGVPYKSTKMLFQAITRVRNKLLIIIIDNENLFDACIDIINNRH